MGKNDSFPFGEKYTISELDRLAEIRDYKDDVIPELIWAHMEWSVLDERSSVTINDLIQYAFEGPKAKPKFSKWMQEIRSSVRKALNYIQKYEKEHQEKIANLPTKTITIVERGISTDTVSTLQAIIMVTGVTTMLGGFLFGESSVENLLAWLIWGVVGMALLFGLLPTIQPADTTDEEDEV
ncbi:MAG: hypothetical protein D6698_05615 [Gammaproteobacteria bacterium]|nr:MAG: hypothetical protein D6698_05615 [Gammaproteobacteria bacterium]